MHIANLGYFRTSGASQGNCSVSLALVSGCTPENLAFCQIPSGKRAREVNGICRIPSLYNTLHSSDLTTCHLPREHPWKPPHSTPKQHGLKSGWGRGGSANRRRVRVRLTAPPFITEFIDDISGKLQSYQNRSPIGWHLPCLMVRLCRSLGRWPTNRFWQCR